MGLFAVTTASPATVAALRYGGSRGAFVAVRMRQQLIARRQSNSEGFLQSWDTHGSSDVVTVAPVSETTETLQSFTDAQRRKRAEATLAMLPVRCLPLPIGESEPCAICQGTMEKGEAVRRLPCAHVFHADCISTWLYVKLTCPLDNLPVDEGLEMLAAAGDSTLQEAGQNAATFEPQR